jgi:two-component system nitrate/nitrite response regulator NarL
VPSTAEDGAAEMRVLIVEDHELLAGTMAMALRQQGLEVHAAAGPSPAAVVELAQKLVPVLILLDLDLGSTMGSGLDLIGPLIETGARVVMVTGVADRARLGACIEAGAVGVVSKAAEFSVLIDTVHRAIEGAPLMGEDERQALLEAARDQRRADHDRLKPFDALSPKEQAVLVHLLAGESAETIADKSYVSLATVRSHIRAILLKLGVNSQLAAVALARNAGWPPAKE